MAGTQSKLPVHLFKGLIVGGPVFGKCLFFGEFAIEDNFAFQNGLGLTMQTPECQPLGVYEVIFGWLYC